MSSKSVILLLFAKVCIVNANSLERRQVECQENGIRRAGDDDVPLTNADLDALCPDWSTNPFVHIQHATHCGGNPEKSKWLQKSIKNRLFGGNPTPPQHSASMDFPVDPYDCTAYCVKNGEGKGHFKFNAAKNCFQFRSTGMCGEPLEDTYACDREDRLCDGGVCVLDDPTCRRMETYHKYASIPVLSTDYKVSYRVVMDSIQEQNVFLAGQDGESNYMHWNNYFPNNGPGGKHFCVDEACVGWAFTSYMNIGQQYEFTLHWHDGIVDVTRCSNGANCISESLNTAFRAIRNNVEFSTTPQSRAAIGTICDVKVEDNDFQGARRAARAFDIGDSKSKRSVHCLTCAEQ